MDQSEHDTDKGVRASRSSPDAEYQRVLGKVTLRLVNKLDIQPGPLMAVMQASPNDPERVANALQQSAPLSARVLSVTNSAAIGVVGEISDVRRAVLHMGAARSRLIAMAFGMHMLSQETGLDPEIAHRMWVNSLEKACLAKHVAEATNSDHADHAYTLGLIQDVGLSALRAINPAFYQQVDANRTGGESLHVLEQQHFGIDHAQIGNHLLQQWDASPLLCEEVLNHHQPVLIQNDTSPANLGNLIAGMLPHDCESMTPDRMEWLIAVHGQFLSGAYDSPEALIKTATRSAQKIHSSATSVRIDTAARLQMLSEIEIDSASMVRQLCEMETQLTRKHQQVSTLQLEAMTDPLTQVLNRRGFNRLAERRLHAAVERDLPICAVVLDLDGFKQINDNYGHEAGDRILIELAKQIRKNVDSSDLFGRLGGDEFAILQINVDHEIARRIVHRVAETCMDQMVDLGDGKQAPLRFSVGAATCDRPNNDTCIADLISAADEAMYASKRAGPGGVTFVDFPARQQAS